MIFDFKVVNEERSLVGENDAEVFKEILVLYHYYILTAEGKFYSIMMPCMTVYDEYFVIPNNVLSSGIIDENITQIIV